MCITVLDMPESKEMTRAARFDWWAKSNHHRRVASRKIGSVEELETLPAGHKAKDMTPWIAWRRERCVERGKRSSTIFLERTRKGHIAMQSDQHWNCFKGNTGGNS